MARKVSDTIFETKSVSGTTELGSKLRSNHSLEDVELALHLLAFNGGNCSRTTAQLEAAYNVSVGTSTLKKWSETLFFKRYGEIQETVRNEINEKLASRLSEIGLQAVEVEGELIERLGREQGELSPRELPGAIRSIAQAASANIEKSALLRGQPTEIVESKNPDQILEFLRKWDIIEHDSDTPSEPPQLQSSTES